jgi:hypothetical protein
MLHCVVTAVAVLWVGWAIWQSQEAEYYRTEGDIKQLQLSISSFDPSFDTSAFGWPLPHSLRKVPWDSGNLTTPPVPLDRIAFLFPGVLIDVAAWCVILVATGCVVRRWAANAWQFRLRTLFSLAVVAAILLGWWKYEHDDRTVFLFGQPVIVTLDLPPLLALLQFPWYVYVPVLFGLGCSIYCTGWIAGILVGKIVTVIHHVAMPKLR